MNRALFGKIVLALGMPVVLLILVELVLRLSGVGFPTDFLLLREVDGEAVWTENPFYTYPFFHPPLARDPNAIVVAKQKPPDTLRIVVMGESAAQGDPVPAFGPPRVLQYLLQHHDPDAQIEVVNAGITAINSHILVDMADELNKLQPDVVVLYVGNNEVIGPFGPGTVFAGYLERDGMIRFMRWLNRTRIGGVIRFLAALRAEGRTVHGFDGLAMFVDNPVPHNDPRLTAVYRRYERNLARMIESAHAAGARVLLSTVAVNIADCPPSASISKPTLSPDAQRIWKSHLENGMESAEQEDWAAAHQAFAAAAEIDDQHAETVYWLGISQERIGRHDVARATLRRAMDLDGFRYRADTRQNTIIRSLAERFEEVILVDADAVFEQHPNLGDADLFVDHVHFSFPGTSWLIRQWAEAILALPNLPLQNRQGPPSDLWLQEEMLFIQSAEAEILQKMLDRFERPPFDRQIGNQQRIQHYRQRAAQLTDELRLLPDDEIPQAFQQRMQTYPNDWVFPTQYALHLISFNRFREAHPIAAALVERYPHRRGPRSQMAFLMAREGGADGAADMLIGHAPKLGFFGALELGKVTSSLLQAGAYTEAAAVAQSLAEIVRPIDYRWRIQASAERLGQTAEWHARALLHIDAEEWPQAEAALVTALNQGQNFGESMFWFGVLQTMKGHPREGVAAVQRALQQMNFARAYYHAGLWQAKTGNIPAAQDSFAQAARHAHDDLQIVNSLAWIYGFDERDELRNIPHAIAILERAIDAESEASAYLLDTYSALLSTKGNTAAALTANQRAMDAAREQHKTALYEEIVQRRNQIQDADVRGPMRVNRPLNYF